MGHDTPRAWHRLPNEDDRAWAAFEAFVEQDPATRSVEATAIATGEPYQYCTRMAKVWGWKGRAAARDAEATAGALEEALAPLREAFPKVVVGELANVLLAIRSGELTPERTVRLIAQLAKALGYRLDG